MPEPKTKKEDFVQSFLFMGIFTSVQRQEVTHECVKTEEQS